MSMRTSRASKPARKLLGALGVLSALLLASTVCTGMVFWTENGVEIRGTGLTGNAQNVQTVTDGAGGAFITWQDSRAGQTDNFAQRVDSSGSPQWAANGIDVGGTGNQSSHPLASDGSGGMIVTWEEYRSSDTQIYAQRLNSSGDPQWVADGLNIKPPKFSSNFA